MSATPKELFAAVLKMPRKLRAKLAEELLDSLEDDIETDAVVVEAERRWQNYKNGKTKAIAAEKIFPSLRRRVAKEPG